jgi:hypothetical protein
MHKISYKQVIKNETNEKIIIIKKSMDHNLDDPVGDDNLREEGKKFTMDRER